MLYFLAFARSQRIGRLAVLDLGGEDGLLAEPVLDAGDRVPVRRRGASAGTRPCCRPATRRRGPRRPAAAACVAASPAVAWAGTGRAPATGRRPGTYAQVPLDADVVGRGRRGLRRLRAGLDASPVWTVTPVKVADDVAAGSCEQMAKPTYTGSVRASLARPGRAERPVLAGGRRGERFAASFEPQPHGGRGRGGRRRLLGVGLAGGPFPHPACPPSACRPPACRLPRAPGRRPSCPPAAARYCRGDRPVPVQHHVGVRRVTPRAPGGRSAPALRCGLPPASSSRTTASTATSPAAGE